MQQSTPSPTPQEHFNSRAFRVLLDCLARPGSIGRLPTPLYGRSLPALPGAATPNPFAVAACLSLIDQETSLAHGVAGTWIADDHALSHWMRLRSNARMAGPALADYVILHDAASAPLLGALKQGTLTFPERSCTAFLCVPELSSAVATWRLRGPGIAQSATLGLPGLPADVLPAILASRAHFPLGIDIFCIDQAGACVGLPRTTTLTTA
jgi:alpha-D-ribose 1-methylphosphonate 5-triphosphate synthase subunit PhnH